MGDQDKLDVKNTLVPDSDLTRNDQWYAYVSRSKRETETIESDTLRATSRMKAYPIIKTSWAQRVLSWFKKR